MGTDHANGHEDHTRRRGPGRPRIHDEPQERLTLYLPATLVGIMDGYRMGQSRTQFVREAVEHWLGHVERRLRGEEVDPTEDE